jgi:lysophospholipase L1-like esterase
MTSRFWGASKSGLFGAFLKGAAVASVYLPTVTSAPLIVAAPRRMVSGYNGNLFELSNDGGTTKQSFAAAAGSDWPDYTAINTFKGAGTLTVTKVYDQSGNARHLSTAGGSIGYDPAQSLGGGAPFHFINGGYLAVTDAGASFSSRDLSFAEVCANRTVGAIAQMGMFHVMNAGAEVIGCYLPYGGAQFIYDSAGTANQFSGNLVPRCNLSAIGVTANATGQTLFCRETTGTTGATLTAGTGTTFEWGRAFLFQQKLATRATLGMVLYPSLSNTDMNSVLASYRTIFSVPTTFDSRILAKTDSIMAADMCTNNVELFRQMSLHGTPEIFNLAIGGQALSDNITDYANISGLFTSAYGAGKCLLLINGGINDLLVSTSGSTTYSRLTSLVSSAHGTGFKVVAATVLPTTTGAWTGAMETQRGVYNTAVLGNAAGADQVVDIADTNTAMGALTAPNNTSLYADLIHPTTLGYSDLAPEWAAKINLLI